MTQTPQLLNQLRDIRLPDPISWWPMAPGWWILIVLVAVLLVVVIGLAWQHKRRNRFKVLALQRLADIKQQYVQAADKRAAFIASSTLLRQAAMVRYGRANVAGLNDKKWLKFLDKTFGETRFTVGPGIQLVSAPYCAQVETDPEPIFELVEQWIKRCCYV